MLALLLGLDAVVFAGAGGVQEVAGGVEAVAEAGFGGEGFGLGQPSCRFSPRLASHGFQELGVSKQSYDGEVLICLTSRCISSASRSDPLEGGFSSGSFPARRSFGSADGSNRCRSPLWPTHEVGSHPSVRAPAIPAGVSARQASLLRAHSRRRLGRRHRCTPSVCLTRRGGAARVDSYDIRCD